MPRNPTLLPEGPYGQIERRFIELSPVELWPEAQNTVFGNFRKVYCDMAQAKADELTELWFEMFPDTANRYLSLWEEEYGLPVAPTGKTLAERRSYLLARVRKGPFSRTRLRLTIGDFIAATLLGDSISFGPTGVALDPGGLPLYPGTFSLIGTFRVYENVRNFSYEVWIKSTITPDIARLTRELDRITPAHLSYTIDNTHADVLDYFRLERNAQPVHYIRDNGATDQSGYGLNGTPTSISALASPGLLHTNVAGGNAGLTFNGTTSFISVADANQLDVGDLFTWEAVVNVTNLPSAGNYDTLACKGTGAWQIRIDSAGILSLWKQGTGLIVAATAALATGTVYNVSVRKRGDFAAIRVSGVDRTGAITLRTLVDTSSAYLIGQNGSSAEWFDGKMDEIAYYNYWVSDNDLDDHNNTRQDVATY